MVGIGASAGGLDAFKRLVENLPPDAGLAYLFVQHLDPMHDSALPEILGRAAHIPVVAAEDGMRVEADHAYVIPPAKTMTVTDGHLRLAPRGKDHGPHLAVDAFLISLADVHGSGAVAVILSGAGSDGARGIEAIKEAGGITMAQDSASASYPSMPEASVATGCVDFVLPPEGIAEQLTRLGKHISQHGWDAVASEATPQNDEEDLHRIFVLLKNRTGVDFQHYRRGTVHRRILRRMMVHRSETRSEYLALLRRNPPELDVLYEDLLIGVTSFFRDPDVFEMLKTTGFPEIMQGRAPETPIRMWVAGCSSGEEPYSLAMALIEFLGDSAPEVAIQVFGTDLNETAVARARAGLYPEGIAKDVSPDRLRRFFTPDEGGYRISKSVRDLCVFSRQNLVRDPPFSHLDLISCRNVLIYLEPILQRRLFPIFHYALEPNGLLLLGSAESARSATELFEPLSKKHKVYHRRSAPTRPLDVDLVSPADRKSARKKTARNRVSSAREPGLAPAADEVEREADRLVLSRFAPAGVVINEHMEITQFRGNTAAFLGHPAGAASLQFFKLVRPELVMPLRAAIRTAGVERRVVREGQIALADNRADLAGDSAAFSTDGKAADLKDDLTDDLANADAIRYVAIEVIPFRPPSTSAQFYVVLFEVEREAHMSDREPGEVHAAAESDAKGTRSGSQSGSRTRRRGEAREMRALREENAAAKRYLQAIVEEHEAANEELRAANEEIQSANEELQSTNEELETTKEEVQSTNEELTTVNEEMRHRNRELESLSGDLMNVLQSTTIPIVIVGRDLRIRRFTPASDRVMRVIPSDAGRPLTDVKLLVPIPDLEQQIQRTIETLEISRQEVEAEDGCWWELTIRPYLTIDKRVDGATLVFSDIDASKRYGIQADAATQMREELLQAADDARLEALKGRELAESANRAKSTFLASISHDLRTPLNAIAGYTELVAMGIRGPVTAEQLQDMARIKRSARHLLALINDILNFAKVEAGQLDFRMVDVDVVPITREMGELMATQLSERSLDFELSGCDADANSTAVARADPERLRQILLNLLTNAVKYTTPAGRVGMDCATSGRDGGGEDSVRITVWDTGPGIAVEQQEHIFEPFVQIDRGLTSPPPDGVGLGLAISRDLARGMGGDLTVESAPGHGSRFTLTLLRGTDGMADPALPPTFPLVSPSPVPESDS
jgi:two-component system CheB/CheR fusion protein